MVLMVLVVVVVNGEDAGSLGLRQGAMATLVKLKAGASGALGR